jgi:hypothetical protein
VIEMRQIIEQLATIGTITSKRYKPWQSATFTGKRLTITMAVPDTALLGWEPVAPAGTLVADVMVSPTGRNKCEVVVLLVAASQPSTFDGGG